MARLPSKGECSHPWGQHPHFEGTFQRSNDEAHQFFLDLEKARQSSCSGRERSSIIDACALFAYQMRPRMSLDRHEEAKRQLRIIYKKSLASTSSLGEIGKEIRKLWEICGGFVRPSNAREKREDQELQVMEKILKIQKFSFQMLPTVDGDYSPVWIDFEDQVAKQDLGISNDGFLISDYAPGSGSPKRRLAKACKEILGEPRRKDRHGKGEDRYDRGPGCRTSSVRTAEMRRFWVEKLISAFLAEHNDISTAKCIAFVRHLWDAMPSHCYATVDFSTVIRLDIEPTVQAIRRLSI
jgi:hypothetical protein